MKILQIDNKYYQGCDVVLLPTESNSGLTLGKSKWGILIQYDTKSVHPQNDAYTENQHLYILSDEEIKEGDYAIDLTEDLGLKNDIFKVDKATLKFANQECKKIIATTDDSLSEQIMYYPDGTIIGNVESYKILLQIPQYFIEHFINEYNKGNVLSKVLIGVEENVVDTKFNIHLNEQENITEWQIELNQNSEISILVDKKQTVQEYEQQGLEKYSKELKQETLEEVAEKIWKDPTKQLMSKNSFIMGAKWQAEHSYSREEVEKLLRKAFVAARMKNKAIDKVGYGSGYGSITGQKRKYTYETETWIKENLK